MGSGKRMAGLMATAAVTVGSVVLGGLTGADPARATAGPSLQQVLPKSAIMSVSCTRAGSCSAGGYFTGRLGGLQGFVLSEAHGSWGKPKAVSRLGAVRSVSCASAGNCGAGGIGPYILDEVNGRWGKTLPVPGLAALYGGGTGQIVSVSCASRGNCSAGGFYVNSTDTIGQAFVVSEIRGQWTNAEQVPGLGVLNAGGNAQITSVSCSSPGNCSAIGSYSDGEYYQGFVVNEAAGQWSLAQQVPGLGTLAVQGFTIDSLSCASAGTAASAGTTLTLIISFTDSLSARMTAAGPVRSRSRGWMRSACLRLSRQFRARRPVTAVRAATRRRADSWSARWAVAGAEHVRSRGFAAWARSWSSASCPARRPATVPPAAMSTPGPSSSAKCADGGAGHTCSRPQAMRAQ
jgi:hypothetical protein